MSEQHSTTPHHARQARQAGQAHRARPRALPRFGPRADPDALVVKDAATSSRNAQADSTMGHEAAPWVERLTRENEFVGTAEGRRRARTRVAVWWVGCIEWGLGEASCERRTAGRGGRARRRGSRARRDAVLVLSRKIGESIIIGDDITITVVDIVRDKVRLGITAPPERHHLPGGDLGAAPGVREAEAAEAAPPPDTPLLVSCPKGSL